MPHFGRIRFTDIMVAIAVVAIASYLAWTETENDHSGEIGQHSITGLAVISDGDTVRINSHKIRLIDIDAPELYQLCTIDNRSYKCGEQSKQYLDKLINGRPITCTWEKEDQYDRLLGRCSIDGTDLNQKMVEDGWAVSYYGYLNEENQAREHSRGIWAGSFERPREWRRNHPRQH